MPASVGPRLRRIDIRDRDELDPGRGSEDPRVPLSDSPAAGQSGAETCCAGVLCGHSGGLSHNWPVSAASAAAGAGPLPAI